MRPAKGVFILFSLSYLFVIGFVPNELRYFLKPAIIISLLVYYYFESKPLINKTLVIALLFSISGDFWLMFNGENYFLIGLGSFLIAHICYILIFRKIGLAFFFKTFIPFVLVLIVMLSYLWSSLGSFKIPVTAYASTIITMGYFAFTLKPFISLRNWQYIFGGSVLFIISDSLIALGKFKIGEFEIPNNHLWIMITYIMAQYCIVEGLIRLRK